jgi:hypothetical protein
MICRAIHSPHRSTLRLRLRCSVNLRCHLGLPLLQQPHEPQLQELEPQPHLQSLAHPLQHLHQQHPPHLLQPPPHLHTYQLHLHQ